MRLCSDEAEIEYNIRDEICYNIEGAPKSLLTCMLQRKAPFTHPLNHKSTHYHVTMELSWRSR